MPLQATVYNFEIELADHDRNVYESLALRVARHPSESEEFLVARVLAYLLEYGEGIAFSRGLSDPDEPTLRLPARLMGPGGADARHPRPDRCHHHLDRHWNARRRPPAQGVESCSARGGLHAQGPAPIPRAPGRREDSSRG